jgi:hypothetical protein
MKGKRNGFPYPERRDIDMMCVCVSWKDKEWKCIYSVLNGFVYKVKENCVKKWNKMGKQEKKSAALLLVVEK